MNRLLNELLYEGFLTQLEFSAIAETSKRLQLSPVSVLRSLNIASPDDILCFLSQTFQLPTVTEEVVDSLEDAHAELLPPDLALYYSAFPFSYEDETVYIALEDPTWKPATSAISFFLQKRIQFAAAKPSHITSALQTLYGYTLNELKIQTILEDARGLQPGEGEIHSYGALSEFVDNDTIEIEEEVEEVRKYTSQEGDVDLDDLIENLEEDIDASLLAELETPAEEGLFHVDSSISFEEAKEEHGGEEPEDDLQGLTEDSSLEEPPLPQEIQGAEGEDSLLEGAEPPPELDEDVAIPDDDSEGLEEPDSDISPPEHDPESDNILLEKDTSLEDLEDQTTQQIPEKIQLQFKQKFPRSFPLALAKASVLGKEGMVEALNHSFRETDIQFSLEGDEVVVALGEKNLSSLDLIQSFPEYEEEISRLCLNNLLKSA